MILLISGVYYIKLVKQEQIVFAKAIVKVKDRVLHVGIDYCYTTKVVTQCSKKLWKMIPEMVYFPIRKHCRTAHS